MPLVGAKLESYDQRRLWQSAFRSISVIPLTQLLIEIRFVSDEGDSVDRYWHESNATTINPFLVSSGSSFLGGQADLSEEQQRYRLQAQRESEEQESEVSDSTNLLPTKR